jgi:hypothetical protein
VGVGALVGQVDVIDLFVRQAGGGGRVGREHIGVRAHCERNCNCPIVRSDGTLGGGRGEGSRQRGPLDTLRLGRIRSQYLSIGTLIRASAHSLGDGRLIECSSG